MATHCRTCACDQPVIALTVGEAKVLADEIRRLRSARRSGPYRALTNAKAPRGGFRPPATESAA